MSTVDTPNYGPVRVILLAAALLALVLAVTTAAGLAPLADAIASLVDSVGYDYALAAVLGSMAVLAALGVFVSGRGSTMTQTEMPTVERPVPVPAAGTELDETIQGWRFATRIFGGTEADAVRERLRTAAVDAIVTAEGIPRSVARERVDSGTWTDDGAAAAFLVGRYTPLGTWLRALVSGETGPAYRARRTIAAIVACRGDGESETLHSDARTRQSGSETLQEDTETSHEDSETSHEDSGTPHEDAETELDEAAQARFHDGGSVDE